MTTEDEMLDAMKEKEQQESASLQPVQILNPIDLQKEEMNKSVMDEKEITNQGEFLHQQPSEIEICVEPLIGLRKDEMTEEISKSLESKVSGTFTPEQKAKEFEPLVQNSDETGDKSDNLSSNLTENVSTETLEQLHTETKEKELEFVKDKEFKSLEEMHEAENPVSDLPAEEFSKEAELQASDVTENAKEELSIDKEVKHVEEEKEVPETDNPEIDLRASGVAQDNEKTLKEDELHATGVSEEIKEGDVTGEFVMDESKPKINTEQVDCLKAVTNEGEEFQKENDLQATDVAPNTKEISKEVAEQDKKIVEKENHAIGEDLDLREVELPETRVSEETKEGDVTREIENNENEETTNREIVDKVESVNEVEPPNDSQNAKPSDLSEELESKVQNSENPNEIAKEEAENLIPDLPADEITEENEMQESDATENEREVFNEEAKFGEKDLREDELHATTVHAKESLEEKLLKDKEMEQDDQENNTILEVPRTGEEQEHEKGETEMNESENLEIEMQPTDVAQDGKEILKEDELHTTGVLEEIKEGDVASELKQEKQVEGFQKKNDLQATDVAQDTKEILKENTVAKDLDLREVELLETGVSKDIQDGDVIGEIEKNEIDGTEDKEIRHQLESVNEDELPRSQNVITSNVSEEKPETENLVPDLQVYEVTKKNEIQASDVSENEKELLEEKVKLGEKEHVEEETEIPETENPEIDSQVGDVAQDSKEILKEHELHGTEASNEIKEGDATLEIVMDDMASELMHEKQVEEFQKRSDLQATDVAEDTKEILKEEEAKPDEKTVEKENQTIAENLDLREVELPETGISEDKKDGNVTQEIEKNENDETTNREILHQLESDNEDESPNQSQNAKPRDVSEPEIENLVSGLPVEELTKKNEIQASDVTENEKEMTKGEVKLGEKDSREDELHAPPVHASESSAGGLSMDKEMEQEEIKDNAILETPRIGEEKEHVEDETEVPKTENPVIDLDASDIAQDSKGILKEEELHVTRISQEIKEGDMASELMQENQEKEFQKETDLQESDVAQETKEILKEEAEQPDKMVEKESTVVNSNLMEVELHETRGTTDIKEGDVTGENVTNENGDAVDIELPDKVDKVESVDEDKLQNQSQNTVPSDLREEKPETENTVTDLLEEELTKENEIQANDVAENVKEILQEETQQEEKDLMEDELHASGSSAEELLIDQGVEQEEIKDNTYLEIPRTGEETKYLEGETEMHETESQEVELQVSDTAQDTKEIVTDVNKRKIDTEEPECTKGVAEDGAEGELIQDNQVEEFHKASDLQGSDVAQDTRETLKEEAEQEKEIVEKENIVTEDPELREVELRETGETEEIEESHVTGEIATDENEDTINREILDRVDKVESVDQDELRNPSQNTIPSDLSEEKVETENSIIDLPAKELTKGNEIQASDATENAKEILKEEAECMKGVEDGEESELIQENQVEEIHKENDLQGSDVAQDTKAILKEEAEQEEEMVEKENIVPEDPELREVELHETEVTGEIVTDENEETTKREILDTVERVNEDEVSNQSKNAIPSNMSEDKPETQNLVPDLSTKEFTKENEIRASNVTESAEQMLKEEAELGEEDLREDELHATAVHANETYTEELITDKEVKQGDQKDNENPEIDLQTSDAAQDTTEILKEEAGQEEKLVEKEKYTVEKDLDLREDELHASGVTEEIKEGDITGEIVIDDKKPQTDIREEQENQNVTSSDLSEQNTSKIISMEKPIDLVEDTTNTSRSIDPTKIQLEPESIELYSVPSIQATEQSKESEKLEESKQFESKIKELEEKVPEAMEPNENTETIIGTVEESLKEEQISQPVPTEHTKIEVQEKTDTCETIECMPEGTSNVKNENIEGEFLEKGAKLELDTKSSTILDETSIYKSSETETRENEKKLLETGEELKSEEKVSENRIEDVSRGIIGEETSGTNETNDNEIGQSQTIKDDIKFETKEDPINSDDISSSELDQTGEEIEKESDKICDDVAIVSENQSKGLSEESDKEKGEDVQSKLEAQTLEDSQDQVLAENPRIETKERDELCDDVAIMSDNQSGDLSEQTPLLEESNPENNARSIELEQNIGEEKDEQINDASNVSDTNEHEIKETSDTNEIEHKEETICESDEIGQSQTIKEDQIDTDESTSEIDLTSIERIERSSDMYRGENEDLDEASQKIQNELVTKIEETGTESTTSLERNIEKIAEKDITNDEKLVDEFSHSEGIVKKEDQTTSIEKETNITRIDDQTSHEQLSIESESIPKLGVEVNESGQTIDDIGERIENTDNSKMERATEYQIIGNKGVEEENKIIDHSTDSKAESNADITCLSQNETKESIEETTPREIITQFEDIENEGEEENKGGDIQEAERKDSIFLERENTREIEESLGENKAIDEQSFMPDSTDGTKEHGLHGSQRETEGTYIGGNEERNEMKAEQQEAINENKISDTSGEPSDEKLHSNFETEDKQIVEEGEEEPKNEINSDNSNTERGESKQDDLPVSRFLMNWILRDEKPIEENNELIQNSDEKSTPQEQSIEENSEATLPNQEEEKTFLPSEEKKDDVAILGGKNEPEKYRDETSGPGEEKTILTSEEKNEDTVIFKGENELEKCTDESLVNSDDISRQGKEKTILPSEEKKDGAIIFGGENEVEKYTDEIPGQGEEKTILPSEEKKDDIAILGGENEPEKDTDKSLVSSDEISGQEEERTILPSTEKKDDIAIFEGENEVEKYTDESVVNSAEISRQGDEKTVLPLEEKKDGTTVFEGENEPEKCTDEKTVLPSVHTKENTEDIPVNSDEISKEEKAIEENSYVMVPRQEEEKTILPSVENKTLEKETEASPAFSDEISKEKQISNKIAEFENEGPKNFEEKSLVNPGEISKEEKIIEEQENQNLTEKETRDLKIEELSTETIPEERKQIYQKPNILEESTEKTVQLGQKQGQMVIEKTEGEREEREETDEEREEEEEGETEEKIESIESRDIQVKPVQKKSHNLLSGVGSKVKHSLAKVKKAITGKSPKTK